MMRLTRLGHVQPRAAQRRVQRHHAVTEQPQHQCWRQMPFEVVPHQQQAQLRQESRQGDAILQPMLPRFPGGMVACGIRHRRRRWQLIENLCQFLLQPRMQYRIGRCGNAPGAQLAAVRAKQGQQFGRAVAHIFMGLAPGLALAQPSFARAWVGSDTDPPHLASIPPGPTARPRGKHAQSDFFLASLSGSVTFTVPARRFRTARPVSHQLRAASQR